MKNMKWWMLKEQGFKLEYTRRASETHPPKMPTRVKLLQPDTIFLGEHEETFTWSELDGSLIISKSVLKICDMDDLFHVIDVQQQTEMWDLGPETVFDMLSGRPVFTVKYHVGVKSTVFGSVADLGSNKWVHFQDSHKKLAISVRKQREKGDKFTWKQEEREEWWEYSDLSQYDDNWNSPFEDYAGG